MTTSAGQAEILAPIGGHHRGGEMAAGGMAADIEPAGIAAEARGVPVDEGDRAAHLGRHGHQVAAGFVDIGEIQDDAVGAGAHEDLGQIGEIGGAAVAPGAAVHEHVDGRVRPAGAVDVELLDRALAVGDALGLAQKRARPRAQHQPAPLHLGLVGGVFALVVGGVELLLVHVAPHQRPLGALAFEPGTQHAAVGHGHGSFIVMSGAFRPDREGTMPSGHFVRLRAHPPRARNNALLQTSP